MAHVREELAFGLIGFFGQVSGLFECQSPLLNPKFKVIVGGQQRVVPVLNPFEHLIEGRDYFTDFVRATRSRP